MLLETHRTGPRDRFSYLLKSPLRILAAVRPEDVRPLLEEAQGWQAKGYPVAGFLSYEAGFALEPASRSREGPGDAGRPGFPLAWFGVFGGFRRFDHPSGRWSTGGPAPPEWPPPGGEARPSAGGGPPRPEFSCTETEYARKTDRIRSAIARGDVYQANLTGRFAFPFPGDPFDLYLALRESQPVRYGAFVNTGSGCVVSLSPELFFRVRGRKIETRPMKGTAPRGLTEGEDRRAAAWLRSDPKNRAENVMIVDLLRNDVGRVCLPGTVRVARPFTVERYRTLLQMVSTVTGTLRPGTTLSSLMAALFPCGSVTGAPKIAAMRLLSAIEAEPRGVYTGAIGILLPGGDMTFSVAIRTTTVRNGRAEAGSGGGIVWDSTPADEYREALLKGRYLADPPPVFRLVETMRWTPDGGFLFLADHLGRLSSSARYFGFRFPREAVLSALEAAVRGKTGRGGQRIRLLLEPAGAVSAEASPLPPAAAGAGPLRLTISGAVVSSRDPFVRHKTTNRAWRDEELRRAVEAGYDEALFLNERGELTEGAITNLFVDVGGRLLTPPVSSGLLPGVQRKRLLADRPRRAAERVLYPEELERCAGIFLTNSVRGVRPAVFRKVPAGPPDDYR